MTRGTCRDVWLPRNLPANPASSDPLPVFFNLAALSAHDEIILADSLLSVWACWCAGFRHVTCCGGPDGVTLTRPHAQLLHELGVRRVLLAFAGTRQADQPAQSQSAADRLRELGITSAPLAFLPGQDVQQQAAQGEAGRQVLAERIAAARARLVGAARREPISNVSNLSNVSQSTDLTASTNTQPSGPAAEQPCEQAARAFLEDPHLLRQLLADFQACRLVGEEDNKLLAYLAATSRLLDRPLAVWMQSSSAAGKTSLLEGVLRFIPPEDQLQLSALTARALYYMEPEQLAHKVLYVAEEEGLQQAAYALKLLQSEGRLSRAAAGRHAGRDRTVAHVHQVRGPVALVVSSTRDAVDTELENRCLKLQVDEADAQTRAIQAGQRQAYTLQGRLQQPLRGQLERKHQQAQRMLRPLSVVLPDELAQQLSFRSDQVQMRREHAKFLSLIGAAALLHQFQRPIQTARLPGTEQMLTYLEATQEDVQLAQRLMQAALSRGLDALWPQTRRLLALLADHVRQESAARRLPPTQIHLTQRQMRERFGWSDHQVRKHLQRLVQLEYVLVHRAGRGNQRYYELVWPLEETAEASLSPEP